MGLFTDSTHLHITTWVIGLILFFAAAAMAVDSKGRKITQMILRLFYVLILITGAFLFFAYSSADAMMYGMKFLFGLLTIGFMEMVLIRGKKGKSTGLFWLLFAIFLFVTLFLGFRLPIGIGFLA